MILSFQGGPSSSIVQHVRHLVEDKMSPSHSILQYNDAMFLCYQNIVWTHKDILKYVIIISTIIIVFLKYTNSQLKILYKIYKKCNLTCVKIYRLKFIYLNVLIKHFLFVLNFLIQWMLITHFTNFKRGYILTKKCIKLKCFSVKC